MRCNNCIHYDVCYQYDIIGEDDSEMCALYEKQRPHGEWLDHSDEGYVECPFCGHATTCDDNIEELHYCFFCGAKMGKEGDKNG